MYFKYVFQLLVFQLLHNTGIYVYILFFSLFYSRIVIVVVHVPIVLLLYFAALATNSINTYLLN